MTVDLTDEAVEAESAEAVQSEARRPGLLRQALRRPTVAISATVFLLILLTALIGPFLVGDPNKFNALQRLQAPSPEHWFGTDNNGRDMFTRVIHGTQASIYVGLGVCLLSTVIGALLGIAAASFSWVDSVLMRIVDGIMSFPIIVLALSMLAIMGSGFLTVIISLTIVLVPSMTRVVRGRAIVVSSTPMIDAARATGAGRVRIMATYVLPHSLTPLLVQAAIVFTSAVLVESALSFIGAGLPPDVPSWGGSLAQARGYLETAWWMWAFPAAALVLTVLSANLIIDGVRDTLDPHGKRR